MDFIWLIFAHCIGDFGLQTEFIATNKNKNWYYMLIHCIIWTACICVALQFLHIYAAWKVLFLVLGHWGCDKFKVSPSNLYIDQLFHIIQCVIVYLC